ANCSVHLSSYYIRQMRGALLDKGLEFFFFPPETREKIKTGEYFESDEPIEGAFERIPSVWNQPRLIRISRVRFESTASVSNRPRLFRISYACFESAASVANQQGQTRPLHHGTKTSAIKIPSGVLRTMEPLGCFFHPL